MPELPEVETVVRTLEYRLQKACIERVEVRYPPMIAHPDADAMAHVLEHQHFRQFARRGKYLLFHLDRGTLIVHLRMEGKFYVDQDAVIDRHTHVIFYLADGRRLLYHDTRKFGRMYYYPDGEDMLCLKKLGKEPWDDTLSGKELYHRYHTSRLSLKQLLLDQSVICGIGNIYANEICFAMRKRPSTPVSRLSKPDFDRMIAYSRTILQQAIEAGGTTIRSYTSSLGVDGRFQVSLMVHGRQKEPCRICQTPIKKVMWKGRGTYYCPCCQK